MVFQSCVVCTFFALELTVSSGLAQTSSSAQDESASGPLQKAPTVADASREEPETDSYSFPIPVEHDPGKIESARPSGWHWYGWQVLVTGGVAGLLTASSIVIPHWVSTPPRYRNLGAETYLPYAAFVLSSPIVHLAHDDIKKSIGSLAINIIVPYLTILAISNCYDNSTDSACNGNRRFSALDLGILAGFIGVPVIDALALGWERNQPNGGIAKTQLRLNAAPGQRGGFNLAVSGIFW